MAEPLRLPQILERLHAFHGAPPAPFPTAPFELILWENVAYLANDRRRLQAFETLREQVGTHPGAILAAAGDVLLNATAQGILAQQFALKLREAARIALDDFGGDLDAVVRLPLREAKQRLGRFPGIGEPGAEKILLFTRQQPLLAPDSNALRVMVRLGLCPERRSYAATYSGAREVAQQQLGSDFDTVIDAHQLLRLHGQTLCRHGAPDCQRCPLARDCAYAASGKHRHPGGGGR
jgi:endonuclease-3